MIKTDQIYTPEDLYNVLMDENARTEFVQSHSTDSTSNDKTEHIDPMDVETYAVRMEQMNDEKINHVERRLQDLVDHPHKITM
jgi:hypothetical protein